MTDATDAIVAILDAGARDLVVEALRADSVRRQRAATRAAAELDAERRAGRKDIRSGAVMVTGLLVAAATLDDAANVIAKAPTVDRASHPTARPLVAVDLSASAEDVEEAPAPRLAAVPPPADDDDALDGGRRTPAQALAETKAVIADLGLTVTRADLDAEDDDGALPEDAEGLDDDDVGDALADLTPAPAQE